MNRRVRVTLQTAFGKKGINTIKLNRVETFHTSTAIDNDADAFSIDIADVDGQLRSLLARDSEVKVGIEINNESGVLVPIFTGIADEVQFDTSDQLLSIQGRDLSCLATDSDAPPGRWKYVRPRKFLMKRAKALGFKQMNIAVMTGIGVLYTDASETEWELWYRMVRLKDKWMWTGPNGALYVDALAYHEKPAYRIGPPTNQGASWLYPTQVTIISNKEQRRREVWVYAENSKTGKRYAASGKDTTIKNWTRKPLKIMTSSISKTTADAKKEADLDVFESIVGAEEITIIVHDTGKVIEQNRIALVQIPELGLNDTYYVVGVARSGGPDGFTQTLRLREQGFALTKRVPEAPKLQQPAAGDPGSTAGKVPGDISAALKGVRWGDSFIRAAKDFNGGFDFALYLAVLMAMASIESGGGTTHITNVREGGNTEWVPFSQWQNGSPDSPRGGSWPSYVTAFANHAGNVGNPFSREAGVGPMQLTTALYKVWADAYGWNGKAKAGEYDGGRWNPDSNIYAAGRVLCGKCGLRPSSFASENSGPAVDPTIPNDIYIGVARYNGSSVYADKVRQLVEGQYLALAQAAVATAADKPADPIPNPQGSGQATAKTLVQYGKLGKLTSARGSVRSHPDIDAMARDGFTHNINGDKIAVDARVLNVILWILQQGHTLNIGAMCRDHSMKTTQGNLSGHPAGEAVDLSAYDGYYIDQDTAKGKSTTIKLGRLLRTAVDPLYPTQLISGGYGNHLDNDCQSLCIPYASYYWDHTSSNPLHVLQEHTDHIHVGY